MTGPLAGTTIVVTRPAAQAGGFIELAEAAGARCIAFPTLAIEPLHPDAATVEAVRQGPWDWAIFTSTNAVDSAYARLPTLAARHAAAVGRATARALESRGVAVDARPESANSEGLLALPAFADLRGQRVLLVKGTGGRDLLPGELRARGAELRVLEVYRRTLAVPAGDAVAALHAALAAPARLVVAVTSAEVLEALLQLVPPADVDALRGAAILVPGPRVAAAAGQLQWRGPTLQAATAEDAAMIAALATQFPGRAAHA